MSNASSSNHKNYAKKVVNSRDREKNKSVESGGSSQCDTPPHNEKDGNSSQTQGKFAGIGVESIQCMAEQVGVDINVEAATNLAEDVSYKLRQTISTIALHSEMLKKSRLDTWDVNSVLMLSDTSPVVGTCSLPYVPVGDEKVICQYDDLIDVADLALTTESFTYLTPPKLSVDWITDDSILTKNSNISDFLQNYFIKVGGALLNLKQSLKDMAIADLATNTRIGPIYPNLFNLAVLVLNDDNLNAINAPTKKPLKLNILDMVDALCSNPCCLDTNVQQQFQRLFPVMVSNILGNVSLADRMVAILTKMTRTWPSFTSIGRNILYDYLSQGSQERLTGPMIKCVTALGREALVQCLDDYLDYIDSCVHQPRKNVSQHDVREVIIDASTCLLRSEPTTYLEDYVTTDYTLYEILGDSIMPRRLLMPSKAKTPDEQMNPEKSSGEEFTYVPSRVVIRRSKVRLIPARQTMRHCLPRDAWFEPAPSTSIHIKVKGWLSIEPRAKFRTVMARYKVDSTEDFERTNSVTVASGLLNRFIYRLSKRPDEPPIFGGLML